MIPRLLHQIWIGPAELPERERQWCNAMYAMNQTWKYKLHGNELMERYKDDPFVRYMVSKGEKWAFISDRLRVLLLRDEGGVYIDADAQPIRPLDSLSCWDADFVAGLRSPFRKDVALHRGVPIVDNTFLGSAKDGRMIRCIDSVWSAGQIVSHAHAINGHRTGIAILENLDQTVVLLNHRYIYCEKIYPETIIMHDTHNLGSWVGSN